MGQCRKMDDARPNSGCIRTSASSTISAELESPGRRPNAFQNEESAPRPPSEGNQDGNVIVSKMKNTSNYI
jgi:hypothetical protein